MTAIPQNPRPRVPAAPPPTLPALPARRLRARMAARATLLLCGGLVLGGGFVCDATGAMRHRGSAFKAGTARALQATDAASLRYISAKGSTLLEEGRASGTLPGSMRVHFDVGATFTGTFTIVTRGGSITGHGSATPHGVGVIENFAGSLTVTSGTGRYAHARGRAGLSGTFNRNDYALSVRTSGRLSY